MTISRDLYLAILSMDSYNRGYGQGVLSLPSGQIGSAVVIRQSTVATDSDERNAGFYALAYSWQGEAIRLGGNYHWKSKSK